MARYILQPVSLPKILENSVLTPPVGMFILDQINYGPFPDRQSVDDVIGGAGTYGVLGARLFSPPPLSKTIGWIVDAGHDFTADCIAQLEALQTHLVLRKDPKRLTTRSWNCYGVGDQRSFRYLTPKKRLECIDLIESELACARCVHLICCPTRAARLRNQLFTFLGLDSRNRSDDQRVPIVVWEPVPDLCTPEHREGLLKTLKLVDVVSPNHDELAGFFADQPFLGGSGEWETIEYLASVLLDSGVGSNGDGIVVVRAGKQGCLVASRQLGRVRLPAYYESTGERNHQKVVDPTGGGNAFIGGFGIGLVRNRKNVLLAAAMGSVAASFAIEQIGIPRCGMDGNGEELWNGASVGERLQTYLERVKEGIDVDSQT